MERAGLFPAVMTPFTVLYSVNLEKAEIELDKRQKEKEIMTKDGFAVCICLRIHRFFVRIDFTGCLGNTYPDLSHTVGCLIYFNHNLQQFK